VNTAAEARKPVQPRSVRSLIDALAMAYGGRTFLIDPVSGSEIGFDDLKRKVRAIAAAIAQKGIAPGDAVAFAASNSVETAAAILGIMYGGYLATAVNLVAGKDTIAYVLEHSGARLVLANEAGRAALAPLGDKVPEILDITQAIEGKGIGFGEQPLAAGSDGLLMYTSGTTGRPKGVVHTHESLLAGGENTAIAHRLSEADRGLCVLPLYHINGLCVTLLGALVSGGSLVIPAKFSVRTFWQTLAANRCSWFSVVPTQISYLLHETGRDDALASSGWLRFGRSASAPLAPDVQTSFEEKFSVPIVETMGLTETAAPILSNPLPPGVRKIGSPGIAYGNEVMIADGELNEVSRGVEGEVLVRGRNVMRCYLKNEAATEAALTPQGWLRTGDLGRMDADGYVFITGRLKELIIKGGENIAPREIDEALYAHPDVVEAAAFAVPCERYGESVEAAVKLADGSMVSATELLSLCEERLGSFKRPDRIHVLAELPKGPSGKIQRSRLGSIVGKDRDA